MEYRLKYVNYETKNEFGLEIKHPIGVVIENFATEIDMIKRFYVLKNNGVDQIIQMKPKRENTRDCIANIDFVSNIIKQVLENNKIKTEDFFNLEFAQQTLCEIYNTIAEEN